MNILGKRMTAAVLAAMIMITGICRLSIPVQAASGEYKSWLQTDSRWGSIQLGSSGATMSRIGCAVTSLAKLVVHSGSATEETFDPGKLCNYLSKNGGFDSSGNIYWTVVTGLVPEFHFCAYTSFKTTTEAEKVAELEKYIQDGYYMAVSVKNRGHWVAVDYVKDGEVYIMDPASNAKTNLFDSYDCAGVTQIRLFKGLNPPPTTGNAPVESYYKTGRYTTNTGLNFRANAGITYEILADIPKDTLVTVEGTSGAWGRITYNGKVGWICLEYCTYVEGDYSYPTGRYRSTSDNGLYVRGGVGSTIGAIGMLAYLGRK